MAGKAKPKLKGKRHLHNIHAMSVPNHTLKCENCNKTQTLDKASVGMIIPCTCGHQMDLVFYRAVSDPAVLAQWLQEAKDDPQCEGMSYDYESTGNKTNFNDPWVCQLVGCSFGRWDQPGVAIYVPVGHLVGDNMDMDAFIKVAAPFIRDFPMGVHGAAIMEYPWTVIKLDVIPKIVVDTAIVAFMDDTNRKHRFDPRNLKLKGLAFELWDIHVVDIGDLVDLKAQDFSVLPVKQAYEYGCQDSDLGTRLVIWGMKRVMADQPTIWRLEHDIIPISAKMTLRGIRENPAVLVDGAPGLDAEIERLEEIVFREMGYDIVKNAIGEWMRPFDLGSTAKVSRRLFDEMGLPAPGKRGKNGYYSTSKDNISDLAKEYPVAEKLLEWREAVHMRDNFVSALPQYINPVTGFVHGHFNQTGAPTGRFSHSAPNLAQIPKIRD